MPPMATMQGLMRGPEETLGRTLVPAPTEDAMIEMGGGGEKRLWRLRVIRKIGFLINPPCWVTRVCRKRFPWMG